jgi:uncharacterized protein YcbK (DUF882 family)
MDFTALITELGIDKLPEENQQRILERALHTLQMRMSLRLTEKLTEDKLKSLESASQRSEKEGQEELARLCPNYDAMYQEEIDKLKDDLLLI